AAPLMADSMMDSMTDPLPTEPTSAVATTYGIGATLLEGNQSPDLTVDVSAMQYAWIFTYPDSGLVTGELHIPIGKDVKINLSAQDVIHSFWVPQFRLKQDVIPGLPTELRFVATKTGTFPIVCTELCGAYHGGMRSNVIVHTPEEYETWLAESQIAQQHGLNQTIAANPVEQSPDDFLSPYTHEMGMNSTVLAQLHQH
ncbi:MAG: cytochrome C oxidase subunit II, partial [Leptolyngbyaceae cyanobacterium bins.59]|nr:cytochrome C oxidase subunit II [Leptolyngbyaceae cyanobacterium bins.59]